MISKHSVFSKYPAIRELKDKLYSLGAMYASMSGSGATVFGIFENDLMQRVNFATQRYGPAICSV